MEEIRMVQFRWGKNKPSRGNRKSEAVRLE